MSRTIRIASAVAGILAALALSWLTARSEAYAAIPIKDQPATGTTGSTGTGTGVTGVSGSSGAGLTGTSGAGGAGLTGTTGAGTGTTGNTGAASPATTGTGATTPTAPAAGSGGTSGSSGPSASINLGGASRSNSLEIIVGLTLLSVAPALLIMMTSFTRIIIVLSLTRNALGLQNVPPNQVLVGLGLFLSLFIMGPTLKAMNADGIQPYLHHQINQEQAYNRTVAPLKTWMLDQTDSSALQLFEPKQPVASAKDLSMTVVVPAFIVSELKSAFTIGFVIFVPFLVIDLIVSSTLMSMGMMMLPPTLVSLPFKLLLFVLVDGWALVVTELVHSFH